MGKRERTGQQAIDIPESTVLRLSALCPERARVFCSVFLLYIVSLFLLFFHFNVKPRKEKSSCVRVARRLQSVGCVSWRLWRLELCLQSSIEQRNTDS